MDSRDAVMVVTAVIANGIVFGFIAHEIGKYKGFGKAGAVLGFVFGLVGVVVAMFATSPPKSTRDVHEVHLAEPRTRRRFRVTRIA